MRPTIQYAPTLLCNSPRIQALSTEEFEAMVSRARGYRFSWTDVSLKRDGTPVAHSRADYDPRIINSLVVCGMGELGMGVFAKELIPKGSVICSYSGLVSNHSEEGDLYQFGLRKSKTAVSAKHQGNLAGLLQHIHRPATYKHFVEEMGLENIDLEEKEDGNLWLIANRTIRPHEQLGYAYDTALATYWAKIKQAPKEFDRFGRILPFTGAIYLADIHPILFYTARLLKDDARLAKLRKENADLHEELMAKTRDNSPSELVTSLLNAVFLSHIDLLRVLRRKDRDAVLGLFKRNVPIVDPADFENDSPYANKRVATFLKWKALSSAGFFFDPKTDRRSVAKEAHLDFPNDFFKIVNPARYYAYHTHSNFADLTKEIRNLGAAGLAAYGRNKFTDAAIYIEDALALARDHAYLSDDKIVGQVHVNPQIITLYWNLGNAYYKAAGAEKNPVHQKNYLYEAEYCISHAIEFVKASEDVAVKGNLAKYEGRLVELQKTRTDLLETFKEGLSEEGASLADTAATSGGAAAGAACAGAGAR